MLKECQATELSVSWQGREQLWDLHTASCASTVPSATSAHLPVMCKGGGIGICSLVGIRETGESWECKGDIKGRPGKKRAFVHKCWAGEFEEEMRNVVTETSYRKQGEKEQTGYCVPVPSVLGEEDLHGTCEEGLRVCKGYWEKCEGWEDLKP